MTWLKIEPRFFATLTYYTKMFSVLVWGCNSILFVEGWFCPICVIHLIGRKSLHFDKTRLNLWAHLNYLILSKMNAFQLAMHIHFMIHFITARNSSCGKVMFSQASVILSVGGCLSHCLLGYIPQADTPWEDTPPPEMATAADGRHPPGMHSCLAIQLYTKMPLN